MRVLRLAGQGRCWTNCGLTMGAVLSPTFGGWRPEVDDVFARLGTSTFSWCGRRGEHEATVMVAGRARYSPGKVMNVACPHQHEPVLEDFVGLSVIRNPGPFYLPSVVVLAGVTCQVVYPIWAVCTTKYEKRNSLLIRRKRRIWSLSDRALTTVRGHPLTPTMMEFSNFFAALRCARPWPVVSASALVGTSTSLGHI